MDIFICRKRDRIRRASLELMALLGSDIIGTVSCLLSCRCSGLLVNGDFANADMMITCGFEFANFDGHAETVLDIIMRKKMTTTIMIVIMLLLRRSVMRKAPNTVVRSTSTVEVVSVF